MNTNLKTFCLALVFGGLLTAVSGSSACAQDEYLKTRYRFDQYVTNEDFCAELELNDDQKAMIVAARERLQELMFERAKEEDVGRHKAHEEFTVNFENEIFDVLLPFQKDRAKQLVLWAKINKDGFGATIDGSPLVTSQLERAEQFQNNNAELNEELLSRFREEYEQLQQKYIDALRTELPDEHQRQFDRNFGPKTTAGYPEVKF